MNAAALRELAEALPPGAAVCVPREWRLELLRGEAQKVSPLGDTRADPTVEDIAARYGRAPSTVRGWCEVGRFPGAYKLQNREWRIPAAALEAFDADARAKRPTGRRSRVVTSLGDWRTAS